MTPAQWDTVRKESYKRANHRCEICGGVGTNQGVKWPVECHETWSYDDATHIQTLVSLISLCPRCHMVKHIGRAKVTGKYKEAISHMMSVNGWSTEQAERHVAEAFTVWRRRSTSPWKLNTDAISGYGVGLPTDLNT